MRRLDLIFMVVVALVWSCFPLHGAGIGLLVNGGFETPELVEPQIPATFADWSGDGGSIVTAENGITPAEGVRMLRFDYTLVGSPNSAASSDQFQLIDMSSYGSEIAAGLVTLTTSALFNRVDQDAQTDTEFRIQLRALDGDPSQFDDNGVNGIPSLALNTVSLITDADPGTWEEATVSLALPEATTYVALVVIAYENVFNDHSVPEFDGHYADDVRLSVAVVPEPTSLALLFLGAVLLRLIHRAAR